MSVSCTPGTTGISRSGRARLRAGYTLIELLTVVAIMSIIMTIAIPALKGILDSSSITRGGQLIGDQISQARQFAAAANSSVEVRFFKLTNLSANGYTGVQLWANNRAGVRVPLKPLALLPQGTAITENTTLSPALSSTYTQPLASGTMSSSFVTAPNAPYVAFQISPAGTVMPPLDAMKNLCFTLVPARFVTSGTLPVNYVTIQINPLTASPLIYRP